MYQKKGAHTCSVLVFLIKHTAFQTAAYVAFFVVLVQNHLYSIKNDLIQES